MKVNAKISFEVELFLAAAFTPGYAATHEQPGEGDAVEDIEVEDLGVIQRVRPPLHERGSHDFIWKTTSVLDGVDMKSPDILCLFANLIELTGDDAESALVEAASE